MLIRSFLNSGGPPVSMVCQSSYLTMAIVRAFVFFIICQSLISPLHGQEAAEQNFSRLWEKASNAYNNGHLDKSIALFKECLTLQPLCSSCAYNIACAYSIKKDLKQAFHWLFLAAEWDYLDLKYMNSDSDLDNLRNDTRYAYLVKKILKEAYKLASSSARKNDLETAFQLLGEMIEWGYADLLLELIHSDSESDNMRKDPRYTAFMKALHDLDNRRRLERAAQLIVMIDIKFTDGEMFGAGIIFGHENDRLYIVTANHVVRKGESGVKNIQVRFKAQPDTLLEARLMEHTASELDVAVVAIDNLSQHGIEFCDLPLDHLGNATSLKPGDFVYLIGNPNHVSWGMPVQPDAISMIIDGEITFQSSFIMEGHSGGALLTERGEVVGLIKADSPPFGRAISFNKVLTLLKTWGYPVQLRYHIAGVQTPLHQAVEKGDLNEVKRQLSNCPDVNALDDNGRSPLHIAATKGLTEIAHLLVEAGADINLRTKDPPDSSRRAYTPLHIAASSGAAGIIELLLKKDAFVNVFLLDMFDREFEAMPLHLAIEGGNVDAVKILLKHGASIECCANHIGTPLQLAAKLNSADIAKILLANGAEVNANIGSFSDSPLHYAAINNAADVAMILLANGADLEAKASGEMTPLLSAAEHRSVDVVRILLSNGANVNARDDNGLTPLHWAVFRPLDYYYNGQRETTEDQILEIVNMLLKYNVDVNAPSDYGTPYQLASEAGLPAVANLLGSYDGKRYTEGTSGKQKMNSGWLGVEIIGISTIPTEQAHALGLKDIDGVIVKQVVPGSPADRAGLKEDDAIIRYNGRPVHDSIELSTLVSETAIGKTVVLEILRRGDKMTKNVTIGERP